jgi:small subunit ribosomal protein S11
MEKWRVERGGGLDEKQRAAIHSFSSEVDARTVDFTFLPSYRDDIHQPQLADCQLSSASMSNPSALRALRSLKPPVCASCRPMPSSQILSSIRPFSSATPVPAKDVSTTDSMEKMLGNVSTNSVYGDVSPKFQRVGGTYGSIIPDRTSADLGDFKNLAGQQWPEQNWHHLHIMAHKHNTHLTLTKPNRDPLISVSCGNIGFRKAGRGTYDAAYQLAAFVMSRIQDKGLLPQIQKLELIYRGFGPGREAVTKAILGNEGKRIRPLITKLSDSTRLKFGGVRSKKPRRLG